MEQGKCFLARGGFGIGLEFAKEQFIFEPCAVAGGADLVLFEHFVFAKTVFDEVFDNEFLTLAEMAGFLWIHD